MFYTLYKVTNLINQKTYVGKHKTKDLSDNYFGSGKLLKRAIQKYGIESFHKEILEVYDQEWKMNLAERISVIPDKEINYNLCKGGQGGFEYLNRNNLNNTNKNWIDIRSKMSLVKKNKPSNKLGKTISIESKEKIRQANLGSKNPFFGKKHSEKTKKKMRDARLEKFDSRWQSGNAPHC